MATDILIVDRPTRWQTPFDTEMTDEDVQRIVNSEPFASMDQSSFSKSTPLADIIRYDARLVNAEPGQIIVRDGEYGNSAFAVITGQVRVLLGEGLPAELLGRSESARKSYWRAFSQLWTNNKYPEARSFDINVNSEASQSHVTLDNVEEIFAEHKTAPIGKGLLFGELAALGRIPRTATVVAEEDTVLLEIRWQGIREICRFDHDFRLLIEQKYRDNALRQHLEETHLFEQTPESAFAEIIEKTLFETHGSFDWYLSYKKGEKTEPLIAREGDYPDGVLLVRAGFARVSRTLGSGQQTLTYLTSGELYGLHEVYDQYQGVESKLETTLHAIGYVDLIRIPLPLLVKYVFPHMEIPKKRLIDAKYETLSAHRVDDWLVDNRFVNATQAMVIDLDSCVRCDDCVRACGDTHDGNPRFKRHGKIFENWMVTNACMHCIDPVCMIGCPTGAIHRNTQTGNVIINDDTCIGCGTCANSCPYDNITLVDIADDQGRAVVDPQSHKPIQKATKCDLCHTNPGGPACVQACPHDALFRVDFDTINPLKGKAQ